jgi:hypothetical protein
MIFDKQNQFSAGKLAAEFTRTAGTSILGDVIDLWAGAAANPNVALPQGVNGPIGGPGAALVGRLSEIDVYVQCTEAFVSAGTGTVVFTLVAKADATLTSGATILAITQSVTADASGANLPAGTIIKLTGDIGKIGNLQYLGILVTVGTATMTAGMVAAGIVSDFQTLHG